MGEQLTLFIIILNKLFILLNIMQALQLHPDVFFWNKAFDLSLFIENGILVKKYIELSKKWDNILEAKLFVQKIKQQINKEIPISISQIEKYNKCIALNFEHEKAYFKNNAIYIKLNELFKNEVAYNLGISAIAKNKKLTTEERINQILKLNHGK